MMLKIDHICYEFLAEIHKIIDELKHDFEQKIVLLTSCFQIYDFLLNFNFKMTINHFLNITSQQIPYVNTLNLTLCKSFSKTNKGFGDFVPSHPLYMMASIFYLIFGLALTSMCINVVQVKLSDHFKHASSKIIGLQFAEAASQGSPPHSPQSDLQSVHSTNSNKNAQPTNVIIADKNTKNTNSTML